MSQAIGKEATTLPLRRLLPARNVGGEVLIRDPVSGEVHFLNPPAAVVWSFCDGTSSLAVCEAALRQQFTVPEGADLEADIRVAVRDLWERGLLDATSSRA